MSDALKIHNLEEECAKLRAELAAEKKRNDDLAQWGYAERMREVEGLRKHGIELRDCLDSAVAQRDKLRAEVASLRKAKPAGVAVPAEVRMSAMNVTTSFPRDGEARRCADWILSLAAAAPQSQPPDARCEVRPGLERTCELGTRDCQILHIPVPGSDAELQALLDNARKCIKTWSRGDAGVFALLGVVEALARKVQR